MESSIAIVKFLVMVSYVVMFHKKIFAYLLGQKKIRGLFNLSDSVVVSDLDMCAHLNLLFKKNVQDNNDGKEQDNQSINLWALYGLGLFVCALPLFVIFSLI
jgi:hypothetical protein